MRTLCEIDLGKVNDRFAEHQLNVPHAEAKLKVMKLIKANPKLAEKIIPQEFISWVQEDVVNQPMEEFTKKIAEAKDVQNLNDSATAFYILLLRAERENSKDLPKLKQIYEAAVKRLEELGGSAKASFGAEAKTIDKIAKRQSGFLNNIRKLIEKGDKEHAMELLGKQFGISEDILTKAKENPQELESVLKDVESKIQKNTGLKKLWMSVIKMKDTLKKLATSLGKWIKDNKTLTFAMLAVTIGVVLFIYYIKKMSRKPTPKAEAIFEAFVNAGDDKELQEAEGDAKASEAKPGKGKDTVIMIALGVIVICVVVMSQHLAKPVAKAVKIALITFALGVLTIVGAVAGGAIVKFFKEKVFKIGAKDEAPEKSEEKKEAPAEAPAK